MVNTDTLFAAFLVSLFWVYLFGIITMALVISYKRPPLTVIEEVVIGVLSGLWIVVLMSWAVGRVAKLLGLYVIDPVIAKIGEEDKKEEQRQPDDGSEGRIS